MELKWEGEAFNNALWTSMKAQNESGKLHALSGSLPSCLCLLAFATVVSVLKLEAVSE